MEHIDKSHQYLIQFMLKNGTSKLQRALQYCCKITGKEVTENELEGMINQINRVISNQHFKIIQCKCEVTEENLLVWINLKNDSLTKLQSNFTERDLEYFKAILQEILNSDLRKIMYVVCINITSTLSGNYTRENGQTALAKWINGGYFVKNSDFLHLGPRLIFEFTTFLRSRRPDCVCFLCSEISFTGRICGNCDTMFHSYCINMYMETQVTCPYCKNNWIESDIFSNNVRDSIAQNSNLNSGEDEQEEYINQPGPSYRIR